MMTFFQMMLVKESLFFLFLKDAWQRQFLFKIVFYYQVVLYLQLVIIRDKVSIFTVSLQETYDTLTTRMLAVSCQPQIYVCSFQCFIPKPSAIECINSMGPSLLCCMSLYIPVYFRAQLTSKDQCLSSPRLFSTFQDNPCYFTFSSSLTNHIPVPQIWYLPIQK